MKLRGNTNTNGYNIKALLKGDKKISLLSEDPDLAAAIKKARYEAWKDPYRGMFPYFSVSEGNNAGGGDDFSTREMESPWRICSAAVDPLSSKWRFEFEDDVEPGKNNANSKETAIEIIDDDSKDSVKSSPDTPENVAFFQCGCPCVDKWTKDQWEIWKKKKKSPLKNLKGKKRKGYHSCLENLDRLQTADVKQSTRDATEAKAADDHSEIVPIRLICGNRPPGNDMIFPCDQNPYCLISLGGILTEYLNFIASKKFNDNDTGTGALGEEKSYINDEFLKQLDSEDDSTKLAPDVRQSFEIEVSAIRDHLLRFVCKQGESRIVDDCLVKIQSIHHDLVMNHNDAILTTDKIWLSTPPGLINLGATCYLNSQLQCLAQNLGFAHGIFSWKRRTDGAEVNSRMDRVLETMQSILARMRYGPCSIVCTNEFSAALSLENNEMQDPNEFARLLFDRMRETLRSSCIDGGDLGDLLPSIFGGSFLYITTCSECFQQTRKSEEFMEVTLPIADDVGLQQNSSVDIQRCVDFYLDPEHLVRDNQYFCSNCNKKCDAKRELFFKKLPPVLNVQLARYVFDRETLAKRKVKTKVLLPNELRVPFIVSDSQYGKKQNASFANSGVEADYVLCAVQNHLGSSAYQGHYTADVMDWTTGRFYEFNDGEVTLLEDGPVSSFEPDSDEDRRLTRGSEDAYNLFYVEKSYLSMKSLDEIAKVTEINNRKQETHDNVLVSMKFERDEHYDREEKVQKKMNRRTKRLQERSNLICRRLLFRDKALMGHASDFSSGQSVWLDSSMLRCFFSCDDSLDEYFRKARVASILNNNSYLCKHSNGLNPYVACRGKLVSFEMYKAVKEIIEAEYESFLRDESDGDETHVVNCTKKLKTPLQEFVITKDSNIQCKRCGLSCQSEMRGKLKFLEGIVSMYDALAEEQSDNEIVPDLRYAISRNFVTSFRKYVENKIKNLTGKGKGKNEGFPHEIDDLDLDDLRSKDVAKRPFEDGPIDILVNSKITCEHGHCPTMFNFRSVHEISRKTWNEVLSVFPNAIEHIICPPNEWAIGNCQQCYEEKQRSIEFPEKMEIWRSRVILEESDCESNSSSWYHHLRNLYLKQSLDDCEHILPVGINALLEGGAANGDCRKYILIHLNDVKRWIKAVDIASDVGKSKKKSENAKQYLKDLLFSSDDSATNGRSWKFRPLACRNHNRCNIAPSSFESFHSHHTIVQVDDSDLEKWLAQCCHAKVAFLDERCFVSIIDSLSFLESIIYGTCSYSLDELKSSFPLISISATANGSKYSLYDRRGFCEWKCSSSDGDKSESDQQYSEPLHPQGGKTREIDLVSELKNSMSKICVHEIEDHMAVDVAASQIMASNSISTADESNSSVYPKRRSRRKRMDHEMFRTYNLEMSPHANLAHLRLLLHEKSDKKLLGQNLFFLVPSVMPSSDLPIAYEIKFATNNDTLREFICALCGDSEDIITKICESTIHLLMSYNNGICNDDERRPLTRKRQTPEEKALEEAVMSSLTEAACNGFDESDEPDIAGIGSRTKSKKRKVEKGFSGTFLQSSSNLSSNPSHNLTTTTLSTEAGKMDDSNNKSNTLSGDSIEIPGGNHHSFGKISDTSATGSPFETSLSQNRESAREMMSNTFHESLPRLDEMLSRLIDENETQRLIHADLSHIEHQLRARIRAELQRRDNCNKASRLSKKEGQLIKDRIQAKTEFEEFVKRLILQEREKLDRC